VDGSDDEVSDGREDDDGQASFADFT